MITSEEIKSRLWNGATELRGSMDASRYKDYMLGLMFYKFLSDKTLKTFAELSALPKVMALHRRGSISHTGWSFDWNNPSMNYRHPLCGCRVARQGLFCRFSAPGSAGLVRPPLQGADRLRY